MKFAGLGQGRRWRIGLAASLVTFTAVSIAVVAEGSVSATSSSPAHGHASVMSMSGSMSMSSGSMMIMPRRAHADIVPAGEAARLAATVLPVKPGAQSASTKASAATVHHVTLELLATNNTTPDFTKDQALAGIAQLQAFYNREMHGTIKIQVDATYDWQQTSIACSDWYSTFQYAKQRVAWVPGADKHLIIMLPTTVDCGYGGLGGEGENVDSGESLITVGPSLGYTAHEFGHNLSLFHAGTLVCSSASDGTWNASTSTWTNGCTVTEYGDAYDVMGAPWYMFDFDVASLNRLGVLGAVAQVPTGTSTTTIAPVNASYTRQRAATWTDSAGNRYWIEARSVNGNNNPFDPHPAVNDPNFPNAVRIIRADPSAPGHNLTLSRPGDTSPTAQDFRVGDTIRLADGTTVTVLALSATSARVKISRH